MTGKLFKYPDGDWVVEVPHDNKGIQGSMVQGHFASTFGHGYKLSLENCQEIERGYDLDKLAEDMLKSHKDFKAEGFSDYQNGRLNGIYEGFQKALEILSDKKFTLKDMNKAFRLGHSLQTDITLKNKEYKPSGHFFEELIQSLQRTEWDVEVVTKRVIDKTKIIGAVKGVKGSGNKITTYKQIPKLDADGCITLKNSKYEN